MELLAEIAKYIIILQLPKYIQQVKLSLIFFFNNTNVHNRERPRDPINSLFPFPKNNIKMFASSTYLFYYLLICLKLHHNYVNKGLKYQYIRIVLFYYPC